MQSSGPVVNARHRGNYRAPRVISVQWRQRVAAFVGASRSDICMPPPNPLFENLEARRVRFDTPI